MQDNLHFFELEIYEIIREDCVRFLRKSTKENLALHDTLQLFRFNKKQHHKLLDLPLFMRLEKSISGQIIKPSSSFLSCISKDPTIYQLQINSFFNTYFIGTL